MSHKSKSINKDRDLVTHAHTHAHTQTHTHSSEKFGNSVLLITKSDFSNI